jgi:hypothetical protein
VEVVQSNRERKVLGYGVGHWYVSFYDKSGRHFLATILLTALFLFRALYHFTVYHQNGAGPLRWLQQSHFSKWPC